MKLFVLLVFSAVCIAGCNSNRIEKDNSITIKLRDGFAKHYSDGRIHISHPIQFEYLKWKYSPNEEKRRERDKKTKNGKEAIKNAADDIGEGFIGQIFTSMFEIIVKGTIQIAGNGIQTGVMGLMSDEVIVFIRSDNGEITKIANEGYNRWILTSSDINVMSKPWIMELCSIQKYRFSITTNIISGIDFNAQHFVEICLESNGEISINKSNVIGVGK